MKTNLLRLSCYILLLAFTSCSSCKKQPEPSPESKLPPATQTGANTAGCLINGQPWIPNGGGLFSQVPAIGGIWGVKDKFIIISFYASNPSYTETISILINDYKVLGERPMMFDTYIYPNSNGGLTSPQNYGYYSQDFPSPIGTKEYMTTSKAVGKVTLTQFHELRSDGPVSGTFEFDAVDGSGKIIKITNGRFDIR